MSDERTEADAAVEQARKSAEYAVYDEMARRALLGPSPVFSWARNLDKAAGQVGYATLVAVAANPDFIPQTLALIPAGVRPLVGIVLSALIVSFQNWNKHRSK